MSQLNVMWIWIRKYVHSIYIISIDTITINPYQGKPHAGVCYTHFFSLPFFPSSRLIAVCIEILEQIWTLGIAIMQTAVMLLKRNSFIFIFRIYLTTFTPRLSFGKIATSILYSLLFGTICFCLLCFLSFLNIVAWLNRNSRVLDSFCTMKIGFFFNQS